VKAFRGHVRSLYPALETAVLALHTAELKGVKGRNARHRRRNDSLSSEESEDGDGTGTDDEDSRRERVREAMLFLYGSPERYPGLYNYAKALECVESGERGTGIGPEAVGHTRLDLAGPGHERI
jgi:hypothetical protein